MKAMILSAGYGTRLGNVTKETPKPMLDVNGKPMLEYIINNLRSGLNVTTVTITHDMVSAFDIADRIGMLHEGKIVFTGTPDEFLKADVPIIKGFLKGRICNE